MNERLTIKRYTIGFILSVLLTVTACLLIFIHDQSGHVIFTHPFLRVSVVVLALAQFIVQLIFFLHLGSERGPRFKLAAFASTIGIVLIVIIGSIWIMNHLNYNMMSSTQQMNAYIQSQDGL
ncbi:MAG TPA: cytochrome o ubiquinol oxidase subunit IV [Candidatus Paceibacterota bacterium]|nr:cytochrome o ubiquinol oxidase subunit IV [Candidatus Paceibacterota bacterium]